MHFRSDETKLVGEWRMVGSRVEGDAVCKRIYDLTAEQLQLIAKDSSGWISLYRDPADGRLWELTYPQGELQGGGPPALIVIDHKQAAERYKFTFESDK